ncbi:hypothetical protein ERICI_01380 [Paenibacillus larvae subsp. larvae]|uniref:Uncharacterized protein n=1 Tax=Paenibacillus larvae subsp. larvae TaxID=147375 RepID=A0A6C0QWB9_9BACL|nr:hypothetical protein [Paenibacillus larvae]AVF21273.1 hypothetical protein ERICI_01380 [Paenibacillus larvae subsp. larvae]ETK30065.1 hypothetical protein ERIC1_1c36240 [Paenibacillus larvae subsp. larvae DSM 25719]PCK71498.1 hypothetical protein PL1_1265 [Paenibacillus larvae subsp. larvae B-3650]MCY9690202.1 hypothetical protein [Paenibacillus larvae]MDV3485612.1 hypothetical protein [Paenibacillus larvae]
MLAACGSKEASTSTEQEPKASAKESEKPKEKEVSAEEKLALEYINVYNNGKDVEAKKKFVEEKVHPDIKQLFTMGLSATPEEKMFNNPEVLESVDYEKAGKKGTTVLVKGKAFDGKDGERIILIMDNKIGMALAPDSKNEDAKKGYDELRAKFKTPQS